MRSRRRFGLAGGLVALLGVLSCDGGSPAGVDGRALRGVVEGTVRSEGSPLSGVSVSLGGPVSAVVMTDAAGAYRFDGLEDGSYVVDLGGIPSELAFDIRTATAVLGPDARSVRIDFDGARRREAALTVRVTLAGEGLPDVSVSLSGPESRSGTTDATGTAVFADLLPGDFGVAVSGHDPLRVAFPREEQAASASNGTVGEVDFPGRWVFPVAPTSLLAAPTGPTGVELTWDDASNNEDFFRVERSDGTGGWSVVATPGAGTSVAQDGGLEPATPYTYRVRACHAGGCSPPSPAASATTDPVPPDPPQGLQATASGASTVALTWTDASSNEDAFQVERREEGGAWATVATTGPDVTGFDDGALAPATAYRYRVRGCNVAGCSEPTAEVPVTTWDVPPTAPTGLSAVALGPGTVVLTWTDASDNESGFRLERRSQGPGNWSLLASPEADAVSFDDTGLAPGTTRIYRVRACNDGGCSDPSNEATATTWVTPPASPTGLQAVASGTDAVDLSWTDASSDETRFDVERSTGRGWGVVASPGGGSQAYRDGDLAPGTTYDYRVRACNAGGCSAPSGEASATTGVSGPNLTIEALTLTQRIQRMSGDVPLVADLPAHLRVFAVASEPNGFQPDVEVDFYLGGVLSHTESLSAGGSGVPVAADPTTLSASWNWSVPAWLVQPGLSVRARVDPDGLVGESDETDNTFPGGGGPLPLDVWTTPRFDVTFVPVRQSVNGRIGDVSPGTTDSFMSETRRMFPVADDDVLLHAEFVTDAAALQSDNGNGAWGTVLSEVNALRTAEGSSRHYYGVVDPDYGGGVAGIGYIGWPTALGWDRLPSGSGVAAHEWGHNLGRPHSPGCGAGSPDGAYPYAGGSIGVWGWDLTTGSLRSPSVYFDLMTYCGPDWISDYVYEKILDFRGVAPAVAQAVDRGAGRPVSVSRTGGIEVRGPAGSGLLVWGRVAAGVPVLEPVLPVEAPATLPSGAGPYRIEGRDEQGALLFAMDFELVPVADGLPGEGHFAFVVPTSALAGRRLARMELEGGGGRAVRQTEEGPVGVAPSPAVAPAPDGSVRLTWDAAAHPMVLVRDPESGQILSFARGGAVTLRPPSDHVELVFSDGLGGTAPLLRTVR